MPAARNFAMSAALAVLFFPTARATAQQWGTPGSHRSGDLVWLATFPLTRKPLELSDEQFNELNKIARERGDELRIEFAQAGLMRGQLLPVLLSAPGDLADDERLDKLRDVQRKLLEIGKNCDEKYIPKIRKVLSAAQFQRVQQIAWQAGGHCALTDPEVVEALSLTPSQQTQIRDLSEEYLLKVWKTMSAARVVKAPAQSRSSQATYEEWRKDFAARAMNLLTDEQRRRFIALQGVPFDMEQLEIPKASGRNTESPSTR